MKLFFDTESGSSFEIEVDYSDTLLKVKQKIEKSQHIPVSQQTLIFDGIVIPRDDLNLEQCQIFHESRLQVNVSPNHSPNHNDDQVLQTEQSPAPSISIEEFFERQDWPLTTEEIKKIYSSRPETNEEISKIRDPPVKVEGKNNQVRQTEKSPVGSDSVKEIINFPDSLVNVRSNKKVSTSIKVGSNNNNNNNSDQYPPSLTLNSPWKSMKGRG